MAFQHFIWDFDGTLYDSYRIIARAAAQALKEAGLPCPRGEDLIRMAKSTLRGAFVFLAGKERGDALMARYLAHSREAGIQGLRPYPGCREALERVAEAGGFNYLYTHRDRQAIEALERDGLAPLFRDFITSEDGFPGKPAPDALLWLLARHGLVPGDCVMIGDREIDLAAGKNAGIASALFDPAGYLPGLPAEYRFTSLTAIPEKLLKKA